MIIEERRTAWEHKGKTHVRLSYVVIEHTLNHLGRPRLDIVNGASAEFLDLLNSRGTKGMDDQLKYLCEYRRQRAGRWIKS